VSCIKDEYDATKEKEDRVLKEFFKTHKGYTQTINDYYYKVNSTGTGISPKAGDIVIMDYNVRILETNRLFDTSDSTEADNNYISSTVTSKTPGPLKISILNNYGFYSKGVCDRLLSMKEGGSDSIVCNGYWGIGSGVPTVFKVSLLKVIPDTRAFELAQISKFLSDNNTGLTIADTTGKGGTDAISDSIGLYMFNKTDGTGAYAVTGDSVDVKYTLTLLPYKDTYLNVKARFIESGSFKMKLGTTSVISGFSGAVRLMKSQGKATVIMPYRKAYGISAYKGGGKQIVMPESSTLIYEMEITRVKKNT
jgi:FKBP-type peptidyl-prolyl cis-trans isomerase